MAGPEPDRGAIAFAEKILFLLEHGRFTATYKYAVLLALMDLCLEGATRSGAAPQSVTTHQLATKVLELYWPHAVTFDAHDHILLQNQPLRSGGGQAAIVTEIVKFRRRWAPDSSAPLSRARAHAPKQFDRLVRRVEWKLVEMPLPKLQRVGLSDVPFIYRIHWDDSITKGQFDDEQQFDNLIRFVGDAGDHFVRLSGLLRPLVQRQWAAMIARYNTGIVAEARLERFLFGVDRISTAPVRAPLRELQNNRCFYCERKLPADVEVDHFIPWARYPNNSIENLVVADGACNNAKRDHLAATEHIAHWTEWSATQGASLDAIARDAAWERRPERSIGVARAIYLRLPTDARLWVASGTFEPVSRPRLRSALG